MTLPMYSTLFSCIYDEPEPIGHIGRGSHYSVFRSVEWLDVCRNPANPSQVHDFAVIWDEDHDTRVIGIIEAIYMAGLLSPVQFIGERKGILTVIVAAKFYSAGSEANLKSYQRQLQTICDNSNYDDHWPVEIGLFHRLPDSPHRTDLCGLVNDDTHRATTYIRNIDVLWGLGTKHYLPKKKPANPIQFYRDELI